MRHFFPAMSCRLSAMRRVGMLVTALLMALVSVAHAAQNDTRPLTSLRAIHALHNSEASHQYPVSFEATVIYYRQYERTLFVQDGDNAIYVSPSAPIQAVAGDRVLIKGTTHESFRPMISATSISVLEHGKLPEAVAATFDSLIRSDFDCRLVKVRATVLTADVVMSSNQPSIVMQLRMEGGPIDAVIDSTNIEGLKDILDAEVEVTGAESGRFDGKMQLTGIELHVTNLSGVTVLKLATNNPFTLPVVPMDEILTGYRVKSSTQRVRVHGTVTYYQPGAALVLQDGSKSLWVRTSSTAPLRIGDEADATGFPDVHDGFLTLLYAEIHDRHLQAPVTPRSVTWNELTLSHHLFDLVTIQGRIVAETRGAAQDEYVLEADGNLFSAIFRHPAPTSGATLPGMVKLPLGSKIRVTGVCVMATSNPFDTRVPFDILLRNDTDIAIVDSAPWLSVGNLVRVVGALLVIMLAIGVWGWTLKTKVHQQTAALTAHADLEAAAERRNAQLEQRRSRILEDINSARPMPELIEEIGELISFSLNGAICWCEMTDGSRFGQERPEKQELRIIRRDIPARAGGALGTLFAALETRKQTDQDESSALETGVRLATLAIETRRLYKDLVYRSEFDLLTDIYNRFSLDRYLEEQIERARLESAVIGLIYIDLDQFKLVNDQFGHHVGDLYLQEVALRMKRQLRSGDMLARLGGDEFAALVPMVRSRAAAVEIAQRLERSFDAPFAVEGYVLRGAGSVGVALYPEDGTTADSLLSAADADMYVAKHTRRNAGAIPMPMQTGLFPRSE